MALGLAFFFALSVTVLIFNNATGLARLFLAQSIMAQDQRTPPECHLLGQVKRSLGSAKRRCDNDVTLADTGGAIKADLIWPWKKNLEIELYFYMVENFHVFLTQCKFHFITPMKKIYRLPTMLMNCLKKNQAPF